MINEDGESNECFNIYYFILIGEKIQNFFSNKNKIILLFSNNLNLLSIILTFIISIDTSLSLE